MLQLVDIFLRENLKMKKNEAKNVFLGLLANTGLGFYFICVSSCSCLNNKYF